MKTYAKSAVALAALFASSVAFAADRGGAGDAGGGGQAAQSQGYSGGGQMGGGQGMGREGGGGSAQYEDQGSQTGGQKGAQGHARSGERSADRGESGDYKAGDQNAGKNHGSTHGKQAMNDERGGQSGAEHRAGNREAQGGEARGGRTRVAEVSPKQRTVIREKFSRGGHHRLNRSDVHFNLSVGTRIPSDVEIVALPADLYDDVPWFRGYDYVLVGDTLLIIDPGSREIVAVLNV
jgi:hypothetical protein